MNFKRVLGTGLVACVFGVVAPACFIDNPNAVDAATDSVGESDAALADGDALADATDAPVQADVDAGTPLCTKYGGYSTVEAVIGDLFGSLVADCRISRFFTVLSADNQGHLYDCLVKQVAVLFACPGIVYDVDSQGVDCRDMITSHKGLAIRSGDFDALIEDLVAVLLKDGVVQSDIDLVAPHLLSLKTDIVSNSAPGNDHPMCDAGDQ